MTIRDTDLIRCFRYPILAPSLLIKGIKGRIDS
jgi:hypothetical protein